MNRSKILAALILCVGATAANAAPIVLNTGFGGSTSVSLGSQTIGSTLSFEYQFTNVIYGGGSFIGINSNFVQPCCGNQFNDYQAVNTGWLYANVVTNTTASPNELVFTANTFGNVANKATVTIRNVRIDQTVIGGLDPASVPEPATLGLLGGALALLVISKRRRLI